MYDNFKKHKILMLGDDKNFAQYPNIDVKPIYHLHNKKDKLLFKLREHLLFLPFVHSMKPYYGLWTNNLMQYDTIFVSDGVRGRDVVQYIKKASPKARIIMFYINTYEYGANNDPVYYKDLGVEIYTYDKEQAKNAGIHFKHYFYGYENEYKQAMSFEKNGSIYQDIFFVGQDKNRMKTLLQLHKSFERLHLKDKLVIVPTKHKIYTEKEQKILSKEISYREVAKNILHSRAILDIPWERQHGISLRPMESIFFEKKLITSNSDIVNYDFYRKENIFILGKDKIGQLPSFLGGEFCPLPKELLDRYTREYWLNSFFV